MKAYKQQLIDEGIGADVAKVVLPQKFLDWLVNSVPKNKYNLALKTYKAIYKDGKAGISKQVAMLKTAGVVGIDQRELLRVFNREIQ